MVKYFKIIQFSHYLPVWMIEILINDFHQLKLVDDKSLIFIYLY
jgi:hypothetical protein